MTNIILCGGSGTRLWPISRNLMPKQFVKLFDNQSLFQLTLNRNSKFTQNSMIVSNQNQYFLALDQIEESNIENSKFLLEPIARNTAPAIALACMACDRDEIVLITPSDHIIKDEDEYKRVVNRAKELANDDYLVTFGITPTFAQTGFGYIEANGEDVKSFKEKPTIEVAEEYLKAGNYYWNSGMFCFKAGVFLEELERYSPEIYKMSQKAMANIPVESNMIRIKQDDMSKIPEDSIDYAVMEKSNRVKVIESDIDWSDLGSFDALYEELPKDKNGNTINENHISIDSKNNFIYGNNKKIVTIDVEDLIVVDTGDALLISKKGSSQKVKEAVKIVKQNSQLHNIHLTAHRPWGTYTVLEDRENYKIKRIVVKSGRRLSLQKHYHRNEHWIVVSGTATVTVGDEIKLVRPNESTYIKMGEIHRLENRGKIPVILIEAQVGEYTGEDDIVRVEDDFKRE
ncbi:Mannose-1-phosphate guanylyltransferase (GDP) [hydrothermal vent metagenome]|uniref:mannose-1-phosphate guanylyltransferase n=1 Tax=hydrothermal vent metagenome TaxID=652676 RepID=A0A1W1EIL6_9ZZZZ